MKPVLYKRMIKAEKLNDGLINRVEKFQKSLEVFKDLPGYHDISLGEIPEIDIPGLQRNLMMEYEGNPVLNDAIQGRITLEDSLSELAQINKSVRKFLPRRKDKAHNERLEQIGELVGYSYHLKTRGIQALDNFVSGFAMIGAFSYGAANLLFSNLTSGLYPNATPEEVKQTMHAIHAIKTFMPPGLTLCLGSFMGFESQNRRSGYLPVKEAEYLDGKVREFYK